VHVCGQQVFDYQRIDQYQPVTFSAVPTAYEEPEFTWWINDTKVDTPGPHTRTVNAVASTDAPPVAPAPTERPVTITVAQQGRHLLIRNTPADGTYDLTVEVMCSQPGTIATEATAKDRVTGVRLDVPGLEQAITVCRKRVRAEALINDSGGLPPGPAAIEPAEEATRLFRELVADLGGAEFASKFVWSIHVLAARYQQAGRVQDGVGLGLEAVGVDAVFAGAGTAIRTGYAENLTHISGFLPAGDEAVGTAEHATRIFRQLATDPGGPEHTAKLAWSLQVLAARYQQAGLPDLTRQAVGEPRLDP
jgi:hypothetical protein